MPSLFTLPRQVPLSSAAGLIAGAKLLFSATGTSSPQNTYSDVALTTPNANPVIADANGVFGAIYLDPSLPDYRVILKTSADVVLYTQDGVPSNQNTSQQFRLKAAFPQLIFEETDAAANNKKWRIACVGGILQIQLLDDAESSTAVIAELTRTGLTPGTLNFTGQYLTVQGLNTATQAGGSLVATLTGMTATTQLTVNWRRTGSKYALYLPSIFAGTSNTTAMTMTGLSGILPFSQGGTSLIRVRDNGVDVLGTANVNASNITFGVGAASGNFTNSGQKGLPSTTIIFWDTDLSSVA